jgi:hypothetical protein
MARFLYWAIDNVTEEEVHFTDENLYEVGWEVIRPDGSIVTIQDLAEDVPDVSVEEILPEEWRYIK